MEGAGCKYTIFLLPSGFVHLAGVIGGGGGDGRLNPPINFCAWRGWALCTKNLAATNVKWILPSSPTKYQLVACSCDKVVCRTKTSTKPKKKNTLMTWIGICHHFQLWWQPNDSTNYYCCCKLILMMREMLGSINTWHCELHECLWVHPHLLWAICWALIWGS